MALSWQEGLERLLAPNTAQADREVLLRDLLSRGPEIADEVRQALGTGDLMSLANDGSESKRVLDELAAVRRQVADDLFPQAAGEAQALLSDPAAAASEAQRVAADAAEAAPVAVAAVSNLLRDPARAAALVKQEARNAVSRTPEGLEMPSYSVLRRAQGYEVREYESFSVVSAPCVDVSGGEPRTPAAILSATVSAYNRLTAYFFGANADGITLELTAPVRTEHGGASSGAPVMSLMLPQVLSASTAPAPSDARLALRQTAVQTAAVASFSGLATEGEVRRCLSRLIDSVRMDGVRLVDEVAERTYTVLQYNGPLTLPWLRTNEVFIPIEIAEPPPSAAEEAEEAKQVKDPGSVGAAAEEEAARTAETVEDLNDDDAPSDMD